MVLEKAAKDRVFIPWEYIFADAAWTGTTADRNGYNLAKRCLTERQDAMWFYIDDIGRASRDGIEPMLLGRLVWRLKKRMIGVSDGFDSNSPMAKQHLAMLAMNNECFVDQLKAKVNRGLDGARRRHAVRASVPLGYRTGPLLDKEGKPVLDESGRLKKAYILVPQELQLVENIVQLFVDSKWSSFRIVKHLNTTQAGGRINWQPCTIFQILKHHFYAGIIISNRYRIEPDPVTEEKHQVERPRKEWHAYRDKTVRVWSWHRWKQIQARVAEVSRTKERRNRVYPTSILSGVLFCGYCGTELMLWHSDGKKRQLYCRNGRNAAHGCGLDSSKALNALAPGILDYVRTKVLTETHIREVVEKANQYLAQEAKKPRKDTAHLEQVLHTAEASQQRFLLAVAHDPDAEIKSLVSSLREVEDQVKQLRKQIADAQRVEEHIPPLSLEQSHAMLVHLRAMLELEPTAVALALQALLGQVFVKQVAVPGRKRKAWVLRLGANVVPLMAQQAADRESPDSYTWGKLLIRKWTFMNYDEIVIGGDATGYVAAASKVVALTKQGYTVKEAAKILGIGYGCAMAAYHFGAGDAGDPNRADLRGRAWYTTRKTPPKRKLR